MRTFVSDFLTLDNGHGLVGRFSTLGAGVASLTLDGKPLILEFEEDQDYLSSKGYHGKTLGRIAGRIPDEFMLNGKLYKVPGEANHICLHGGMMDSLTFRLFDAVKEEDEKETRIIFHYLSADGECGFPGNLDLFVTYAFLKGEENIFQIRYEATSDKDTLLSLSNHIYWNINASKSVNDYTLQVNASKCGSFKPGSQLVVGIEDVPECLDFRTPSLLQNKLDMMVRDYPEIGTFDHTLILDDCQGPKVILETDSIKVEVDTDFDSVNFYVDTSLVPYVFKNCRCLSNANRRAIAIEPEACPIMSNIILKAGEKYSHFMTYKISKK
jgi:aldose 1-epimerase